MTRTPSGIKINKVRPQFLPSSTHWAKQMDKINYWHQYTIDAVQSFTFLRRTIEKCNNIIITAENVSFALLNGWNVTITSFDHAWAGMEGSCLWVAQGPNSERDSIMPCAVKSTFKTGLHFSLERSIIQRRHNMNEDLKCREVKIGFCNFEINANWFFWDSYWLEIWKNHLCPSVGSNGGSVAMDSESHISLKKTGFYPSNWRTLLSEFKFRKMLSLIWKAWKPVLFVKCLYDWSFL